MFSSPNETEQKMWNLMRLGLHELETGKYLVIKEIAPNPKETTNSARPELNYLATPKIGAQITKSNRKQARKRNELPNFPQILFSTENFPQIQTSRSKAKHKTSRNRARPHQIGAHVHLLVLRAQGSGRFRKRRHREKQQMPPCPRAPLPSSKTAGSRGPTGGPAPQCDGGTEQPRPRAR